MKMEILQVLYLHIFDEFEWDDETELISLGLIRKINTYLQSFKMNYSNIFGPEFIEIEGSHAKTLYRILKQWRYTW